MLEPDHNHADEARDEAETNDETAAEESLPASRPTQLWLVAAVLCLFAAAALWLLGRADAAFVVAAFGVVSWFLNVRVRLRYRIATETQRHREKTKKERLIKRES